MRIGWTQNNCMASRNKSSRSQEAHKQILADLLKDPSNKICADCRAKGPRWASWNLGVFMCIRCAGIHRNLGVHISRVKSVNLDTWTDEQIESISSLGNAKVNSIYECGLPNGFVRPMDDFAAETFIRAKYEHKKYCRRLSSPPGGTQSAKKPSPVEKTRDKRIKEEKGSKSLSVPAPRKVASAPVLADREGNPVIRTATATSSPRSRPRGPHPIAASPQKPSVDLLSMDDQPAAQPDPGASLQAADSMTFAQGHGQKDSIMSLYGVQQQQQQYPGFVGYQRQPLASPPQVAGAGMGVQYPSMYQQQLQYQQQLHLQQQMHVQQVQEQMAKLKMQQQPSQVEQASLLGEWSGPQPAQVAMAGQTMNNQLWQ